MWTSDPIHLRNVLYIPLDKSAKAKDLVLSQLESNSGGALSNLSLMIHGEPAKVDDGHIPSTVLQPAPLTIRRIPSPNGTSYIDIDYCRQSLALSSMWPSFSMAVLCIRIYILL